MPKINLPNDTGVAEIEATKANMELLVTQIEYLLEGRIDIDNMDVMDGDYALVSADTVQDIASNVRPIGGVKVFGAASGELSSTETAFLSLVTKMQANGNLVVLDGLKVSEFLRDDSNFDLDYPHDIRIEIQKSPDLKLYPKINGLPSASNYYNLRLNAQASGEETNDWHAGECIVSETAETILITVPIILGADWNNGSQMTISVEAFIICERLL